MVKKFVKALFEEPAAAAKARTASLAALRGAGAQRGGLICAYRYDCWIVYFLLFFIPMLARILLLFLTRTLYLFSPLFALFLPFPSSLFSLTSRSSLSLSLRSSLSSLSSHPPSLSLPLPFFRAEMP